MLRDLFKVLDKDKPVWIQMHRIPDPDAIGCAFALQYYLSYKKIGSKIVYSGEISKFETKLLIETYELKMYNLADIMEECTEYHQIIVVDCQADQSNILKLKGRYIACVDHHQKYGEYPYIYSDIRPEYGACSTIFVEYFLDDLVPWDSKIATLLLQGINVDTQNLTRGTHPSDVKMSAYLFQLSDGGILKEVNSKNMGMEDLYFYRDVFNNFINEGSFLFSYAKGKASREMIASIADVLLGIRELNVIVLFMISVDKMEIVMRSSDPNVDCGKMIQEAIGPTAGGHKNSAGGIFKHDRLLEYSYDENLNLLKNLFMRVLCR